MIRSMLSLTLTESEGLVRLQLGSLAGGEGMSLQDAADDLIRRLLGLVITLRSTGFTSSCEVPPDLEVMDFLFELSEIAAGGGDIRARVFC